MTAQGTTLDAGACPDAGTGVFAGKKWAKCGPATVSDGTIRMSIDSEVEGSGAAMRQRTDTTGKPWPTNSIKRFVDPADIATLAVFLASDAERSISGQAIPIDGDSQNAS